jgi:hypothetical protein
MVFICLLVCTGHLIDIYMPILAAVAIKTYDFPVEKLGILYCYIREMAYLTFEGVDIFEMST